MKTRYAGVLLPITALPSPYGVGSFGAKAKAFVDFLVKAGQSVWQVLPLVPTGYGDSPYSSSCATAGKTTSIIAAERIKANSFFTIVPSLIIFQHDAVPTIACQRRFNDAVINF